MPLLTFLSSLFQHHGPLCQSCSMPLSKDPQGGGTEADATRSMLYCSFCYQHGVFTVPTMTPEEMQQKIEQIMKGMNMPGFIVRRAVASIPKLRRWRGNCR